MTGIVWDVDDTLFLERDYARSGFRAVDARVADRFGATGFFDAAWGRFLAGERGRIFDGALADLGVDAGPADIADLVGWYRGHAPEIALLPDARAALERFAATGRVQAAVTDGPEASQAAKVAALGLSRWCAPIVITARLGRSKPDPEVFREVERATGLSGAALVYVADNPAKDFAGPRSLGWRTYRVRRPLGLHADVPSGPDVDAEGPDVNGLTG